MASFYHFKLFNNKHVQKNENPYENYVNSSNKGKDRVNPYNHYRKTIECGNCRTNEKIVKNIEKKDCCKERIFKSSRYVDICGNKLIHTLDYKTYITKYNKNWEYNAQGLLLEDLSKTSAHTYLKKHNTKHSNCNVTNKNSNPKFITTGGVSSRSNVYYKKRRAIKGSKKGNDKAFKYSKNFNRKTNCLFYDNKC